MFKNYKMELNDFLQDYSNQNQLDLRFTCKKVADEYHISIFHDQKFLEKRVISSQYVNNFFEKNDQLSREMIVSIIPRPGPKDEIDIKLTP